MATIINTPAAPRENSDSAVAGWAVAVIVLLAVGLIALFVWPGYMRQSAPPTNTPSTNINVQLPATSGAGADTDTSGGTQQTPSQSLPTQ